MSGHESLREPERQVPVVSEVDIAVVGGSCTGVFAAVRAARLGMKVAIVEKQNCFGGTATAGMVNVWHSLYDTEGRRTIIGGLTREVIDRLDKRGAVLLGKNPFSAFRLNTEELKIELDELVTENGIEPFLHTFYSAPHVEDGAITAVIIENKNGRQAIKAHEFVDATGDADLARDLGLPSHNQKEFQPPTMCAKIHGWSSLSGFDWQAAVRKHGEEFGLEPDWGWGGPIPGLPDIQFRADTHIFDVDVSDANQLTGAEIEGRRKIRAFMDLVRQYGPSGISIALADLAAALGGRESPRIKAGYRLTGEDVLYGKRFDDAIANGSYHVDIHHSNGTGITFRNLDGTEFVVPERGRRKIKKRWREPLPQDPTFYQIPFRSLIPEQIPNLVLAGRTIDADKQAFSATRVMVNTNQTGEAAGTACALALKNAQPVGDIDTEILRKTLSKGGSVII